MNEPQNQPTPDFFQHLCSADIVRLENALKPALDLARIAHSSAMKASEEKGGSASPTLAMMELSLRALQQSNDAARYARHALTYQPTQQKPN